MPSTWEPRTLASILARHERLIQQMSTQQQSIISNLQGQPVIATGLVPGSNPAAYGFQFLEPSTQIPIMFAGEDGSGDAGIFYYDINGNLTRKQDNSGDTWYNVAGHVIRKDDPTGTYWYDGTAAQNLVASMTTAGLKVYNPSTATEEVAAGLLNASPAIYGLGVLPYGGSALQQVGGALYAYNSGSTTVSAATSLSVSITAEIGPSGQALTTFGGDVNVNSTPGGEVILYIDGVASGGPTATYEGSGISVVSQTWRASGLSAGTHTFALYGSCISGSCFISWAGLTVQPL